MPTFKQPDLCQDCHLRLFNLPPSAYQVSPPEFHVADDGNVHKPKIVPSIAVGARMEPEVLHFDWLEREAPIDPKRIKLPSKDEIAKSLWMPQDSLMDMRDYSAYECHDIRIGVVTDSGQLLIMYCERTEPHKNPESLRNGSTPILSDVETAPINGFYWPIGGRRMYPAAGSPLDGRFSLYDSVALKAHMETKLDPKDMLGIYDLGIGTTDFSRDMTYLGHGKSGDQSYEFRHNVHMPNPQRTINRNFVILVKQINLSEENSVKGFKFITQDELRLPDVQAKFSSYELSFLSAVFVGWQRRKQE